MWLAILGAVLFDAGHVAVGVACAVIALLYAAIVIVPWRPDP